MDLVSYEEIKYDFIEEINECNICYEFVFENFIVKDAVSQTLPRVDANRGIHLKEVYEVCLCTLLQCAESVALISEVRLRKMHVSSPQRCCRVLEHHFEVL